MMDSLLKNKIIDSRNEELWDSLVDKYEISVNVIDSDSSRIIRDGNKVLLELAPFQADASIFTHELLHLWLWDNGCNFVNSIQIFLNTIDCNKVHDLFKDGFDYTMSNLVDHILMREEYEKMGYERSKFLPDKNAIIDSIDEIVSFCQICKKCEIKHDRAFIIFLLSIYEHKYTKEGYCNILLMLENTNKGLFDLITGFINNLQDRVYKLSYDSCISFLLNDLDDYYSSKL